MLHSGEQWHCWRQPPQRVPGELMAIKGVARDGSRKRRAAAAEAPGGRSGGGAGRVSLEKAQRVGCRKYCFRGPRRRRCTHYYLRVYHIRQSGNSWEQLSAGVPHRRHPRSLAPPDHCVGAAPLKLAAVLADEEGHLRLLHKVKMHCMQEGAKA